VRAAGVPVACSQVRQILLREGVRWRHPRSWTTSPDPEVAPKGRRSSRLPVGRLCPSARVTGSCCRLFVLVVLTAAAASGAISSPRHAHGGGSSLARRRTSADLAILAPAARSPSVGGWAERRLPGSGRSGERRTPLTSAGAGALPRLVVEVSRETATEIGRPREATGGPSRNRYTAVGRLSSVDRSGPRPSRGGTAGESRRHAGGRPGTPRHATTRRDTPDQITNEAPRGQSSPGSSL
jgi:hypothetical protein